MFVLIVALVGAALLATAYVAGERLGRASARRLRNVALVLLVPSVGLGLWTYVSSARACALLGRIPDEIHEIDRRCLEIGPACDEIRDAAATRDWKRSGEHARAVEERRRALEKAKNEYQRAVDDRRSYYEVRAAQTDLDLVRGRQRPEDSPVYKAYKRCWRERASEEDVDKYDRLSRDQSSLVDDREGLVMRYDRLVRMLKERKRSFWVRIFVPPTASRYQRSYIG